MQVHGGKVQAKLGANGTRDRERVCRCSELVHGEVVFVTSGLTVQGRGFGLLCSGAHRGGIDTRSVSGKRGT